MDGCQALDPDHLSKAGYRLGIRLESQPSSQLGLLARTLKPSLESPKSDAHALGSRSMRRCGGLQHDMQWVMVLAGQLLLPFSSSFPGPWLPSTTTM